MASILPTLKFITQHPLSARRPLSAYWRYARWQVAGNVISLLLLDMLQA